MDRATPPSIFGTGIALAVAILPGLGEECRSARKPFDGTKSLRLPNKRATIWKANHRPVPELKVRERSLALARGRFPASLSRSGREEKNPSISSWGDSALRADSRCRVRQDSPSSIHDFGQMRQVSQKPQSQDSVVGTGAFEGQACDSVFGAQKRGLLQPSGCSARTLTGMLNRFRKRHEGWLIIHAK